MASQGGRIGASCKAGLAALLLLLLTDLGRAQTAPCVCNNTTNRSEPRIVRPVVARSDPKACLMAARASLVNGDLEAAEALVVEAEKAQPGAAPWTYLLPWIDSPAKVRRDIQTAKANRAWPIFRPAKEAHAKATPPPALSVAKCDVCHPEVKYRSSQTAAAAAPLPAGAGPKEKRKIVATAEPPELPKPQTVVSAETTVPAPVRAPALHEGRTYVKWGRELLHKDDLQGAEIYCRKAALAQGWTWFEDTPAKLLGDIEKARAERDRKASDKLLAEARARFANGQYQEARNMALTASRMHGPYSFWDKSERPKQLLDEINRTESRMLAGKAARNDIVAKAAAPPPIVHQVAKAQPTPAKRAPSLPANAPEEPWEFPTIAESAPTQAPPAPVVEPPPLLAKVAAPPPPLPAPPEAAAPTKIEMPWPPPQLAAAPPPPPPPATSIATGENSIAEKMIADGNASPAATFEVAQVAKPVEQTSSAPRGEQGPLPGQQANGANQTGVADVKGATEESETPPPDVDSAGHWPLGVILLTAVATPLLFNMHFWRGAALGLASLFMGIFRARASTLEALAHDSPGTSRLSGNSRWPIGVEVRGSATPFPIVDSVVDSHIYENVVAAGPCLTNCVNTWEIDNSHAEGFKPIYPGRLAFVVHVSAR